MAREGAMLGVPSIYCGIRIMKANKLLMNMNILKHFPGKEMIDPANEYIGNGFNETAQQNIRHQLAEDWDDMIVFMMKQIHKYKKN